MPPEFVVAGHIVRDVVPEGWRAGGTVTFAAVQAHRLGLSVGVVTRVGEDIDVPALLPFAEVVALPSPVSTSFENVYQDGHRKQRVRARGGAIDAADVPAAWRSPRVALVGPGFGEMAPGFARVFSEPTLTGVSVQGWLRDVDAEGHVVRTSWQGEPFWAGADVVFCSDEDLRGGRPDTEPWTRDVPIVAMTESHRGAQVWAAGAWRRMESFPEDEVDPTGAGDTFATAFLIRLHETGEVDEAARFGAAAASLSVGGPGVGAIPRRDEIEARMRQYPEIRLR